MVIAHQLRYPNAPWLTSAAISYLDTYLTKEMRGFEWGSGRSTKWFAERVQSLVSIEDDLDWFSQLRGDAISLGVDYRFVPKTDGCGAYSGQIAEFPDRFFDFILVDGSCRAATIKAAVTKVKPNGLIVVDNADSDIDVSPLSTFQRIETDNGVWRTDIYVKRV